MYAIVREGNGQYYMSMVFGYYDMGRNSNDYKHRYWVVLNKEKTALVNQATLFPDSKTLSPVVLIVDSDESNWRKDNDKMQSVDFLPTETLFDLIENNTISEELLQLCIILDKEYVYNPYPEVSSEKDIKDLEEWVAGRFHDAYISKLEESENELYVYFKGMWGCDIEVWFSGEVSYDTSSRNPEEFDPYWGDSTVFFHDGFVYLIDDEYATVENAKDGWCWFKARHMKYHVIPE